MTIASVSSNVGISNAYSALLGTIVNTANSASSLINATTSSVTMLEAFITKAATEQAMAHKVAATDYEETLAVDAAQRSVERQIKALEFCAKSEVHLDLYQKAHAKYTNLLSKAPQPSA